MSQLKKFTRLTHTERRLLIEACCLLVAIAVALRWLSLKRLGRILTRRLDLPPRPGATADNSTERIVWALRVTARIVPGATCLVQSLAALRLLLAAGHPARLKIGTRKDPNGSFSAHAWVEFGAEIVLGATAEEVFAPILLWEGSGWRNPALTPT